MPVSIKDIARLAGVSHSTVSRALHKSPLLQPARAQRIQQIAQEQGYTASAVARSLVTRRTQAIGVVVTSIADPFNGDGVAGIEARGRCRATRPGTACARTSAPRAGRILR